MFLYQVQPIIITGVCVYCFNKPPSGVHCTYGMKHDWEEQNKSEPKPVKQVSKPDYNKCIKCGLHNKNPQSKLSDCQHQYLQEN